MSYVFVAPEMVAKAAGNLSGIGSAISEANSAAAACTAQLLPAAQDEVSGAVRGTVRRLRPGISNTQHPSGGIPPTVRAADEWWCCAVCEC